MLLNNSELKSAASIFEWLKKSAQIPRFFSSFKRNYLINSIESSKDYLSVDDCSFNLHPKGNKQTIWRGYVNSYLEFKSI